MGRYEGGYKPQDDVRGTPRGRGLPSYAALCSEGAGHTGRGLGHKSVVLSIQGSGRPGTDPVRHAIQLRVRRKDWVVLGVVLAAFGFFIAAFLLLGEPAAFISWSALAVGLLVAALGFRSLPEVGVLPVFGLLVAALAGGFQLVGGWVVHPGDLTLLLSNAALLLGMAAAAGASWRAWREAALKLGDLRVLGAGFLLGAAGGAGYFVRDGLGGGTQFLGGDVLVLIGLALAAWKMLAWKQRA